MTDEKMRVKIAEVCGWTVLDVPVLDAGFASYAKDPNGCLCPSVPNYPQDLNACHEMEDVLFEMVNTNEEAYYHLLICITSGRPYRASSRQRCEAFLRTIGKWEEDV